MDLLTVNYLYHKAIEKLAAQEFHAQNNHQMA
jgi:hypothetical protein